MSVRVLVIKTSSMGDILHTLPALTDAAKYFPDLRFDWLVEEDFSEIPAWHSHVDHVFQLGLRRWRQNIWQSMWQGEWRELIRQLRRYDYDYIIDAQGLTKSAIWGWFAKGKRHGLSSKSARDPTACLHYHQNHVISWQQHAVLRVRELFARVLQYDLPDDCPDYGIRSAMIPRSPMTGNYVVFLHGTTWTSKRWPESYWRALTEKVIHAGFHVYLNSGNKEEFDQALRIVEGFQHATAMPHHTITTLASILSEAQGVVAVDTGLGHLAAALAKPAVSIYGSTDPAMTGTYGVHQTHLPTDFDCAPCLQRKCSRLTADELFSPCYTQISPERVWQQLEQQMLIAKGSLCA